MIRQAKGLQGFSERKNNKGARPDRSIKGLWGMNVENGGNDEKMKGANKPTHEKLKPERPDLEK
jgi:hypothetical protein